MENATFLEQIKTGDSKALEILYKNTFHKVATYVRKNSGTQQEAEDIFQDALLAFIKYICQPDFKLTSKPEAILYAIAKRLWLRYLRDHKKTVPLQNEQVKELTVAFENEAILEKQQYETKHQLIKTLFSKLKADCQELLKADFFDNKSQKDIAAQMGYTKHFVKIKKRRCLNAFKKIIENETGLHGAGNSAI